MTHSFSIGEAIRFGWHTVKSHSAIVFQVVLTLLALQVVQAIVDKVLGQTALGNLASFVLAVVGVFVGTGATLIALRLARHEHATYHQIWPDWKLVWRVFASGVLAGLAMLVPVLIAGLGMLILFGPNLLSLMQYASTHSGNEIARALAVNGAGMLGTAVVVGLVALAAMVYICLRFSMSRFEVLDGAEIVESLRKSAIITRGVKWKLLGFVVVIALMNLVGAILLLLPLLVTLPISMIAMAHVYTKLRAHHTA